MKNELIQIQAILSDALEIAERGRKLEAVHKIREAKDELVRFKHNNVDRIMTWFNDARSDAGNDHYKTQCTGQTWGDTNMSAEAVNFGRVEAFEEAFEYLEKATGIVFETDEV